VTTSPVSPPGAPSIASVPGVRDERLEQVDILLHRLDRDLPAPSYAHPGDAGADLMTAVDVVLQPGERQTVPTGVAVALPAGYAGFVHPRSGLAARHGVTIVNAPGTVDAGYRGELRVTLVNTDPAAAAYLRRGDRIAQLVVQRVSQACFVEVEALPGSARGAGGFGSTGGFGAGESFVRGSTAPERGES
jgi:dUTP pyrophosphatase